MGAELQMVETTWGNAVAGLQANQFDTMFILDPTPVRALSVDFSSSPVLWYPVAGLVKNTIDVKQWSDLNDPKYRLGVALGSSTDQFATRTLPKATINRYNNTGDELAAFQSDRIDVALTTAQTSDLARAQLRTGKTIILKPIAAVPAGAALRYEADYRWKAYLTTVTAYYYNVGKTQEIYNDFIAFRGLDPKEATPIAREYW
jgi:polar amino acid transport system substrate-binding protein